MVCYRRLNAVVLFCWNASLNVYFIAGHHLIIILLLIVSISFLPYFSEK